MAEDSPGARTSLRIVELFASIQGESTHAGRPCVFVRTVGCNLACSYCDTDYARAGGEQMSVEQIVDRVLGFGLPLVEVTGGEPLAQAGTPRLLSRLCDAGLTVLLETNGSLDVGLVDPRVIKIVDLKAPSSGEAESNYLPNLDRLSPRDEVKFVLGDRVDYDFARELLERHALPRRCTVLFAPVFGRLPPADLAAWILRDRLDVRLQVQLHKIIWDPAARGV